MDTRVMLRPCVVCQSLQPYACKEDDEGTRALRRFAAALEDRASQWTFEHNPRLNDVVWHCFAHMLRIEQRCAADDHLVFYRLVQDQMVFYELYSYLLHHLYKGPRAFPHDPAGEVRLVPCGILTEALYPDSVEEMVRRLRSGELQSDLSPGAVETLLAANTVLLPQGYSRRFHRAVRHESEACPFSSFCDGYTGSFQSAPDVVGRCLADVLELSQAEIDALAPGLEPLYERYRRDDGECNGHCLQLCVPRAAVDLFAFPSIHYGHPATVYRSSSIDGRLGVHVHRDNSSVVQPPMPADAVPLRMEEFMDSDCLHLLQARLVGHPNLFLQHGAYAEAHCADESYDRGPVLATLDALLRPHVDAFLARRPHGLRFCKFARF